MSRLGMVAAAVPLFVVLSSRAASAQEAPPPPPPPPPGGYVAPLSQTYQGTYVPQSVALSGPEEIDAEEGHRAPDGYTPVQRTRKGLLIGGGVTLGASYTFSVMVAAIGEDLSEPGKNEVASLWIPVAGPFLQAAQTDSATARVFLVGLGAAQVTGAILLYKGLTSKKTVYVRNDLVGSLQFGPMTPSEANNYATGMLVGGRF